MKKADAFFMGTRGGGSAHEITAQYKYSPPV